MNILVTTPTFHPVKGGAESFLGDLLQQFVHGGHKATVFTSLPQGSDQVFENYKGISIVRSIYPSNPWNLLTRSFSILKKLRNIIKKERVDVVCIGLVGIESVAIWMLHRFLKFKLVVLLHGSELRSYVQISRPVRLALRYALKRCLRAIAVSRSLKEEAITFEPSVKEKIFAVPCGIDIEAVRKALSITYRKPYILYVGRLHALKQIPTLLKAFRTVSAKFPQLRLVLAGSGPEEATLKELALELKLQEKIKFLGSVERLEIFRWIQGCDALVLPSSTEGCPVVVLEALAAGKIIIASRAAGIIEILEDRKNGILFECGDSESLARKMAEVLSNSTLRSQIESNVRNSDLSVYDIAHVAKTHSELYLSAAKSMRVCLISAGYGSDEYCGGIATYYDQLNHSLLRLGVQTHMITSASERKAGNEIVIGPTWESMTAPSSGLGSLRRLYLRFVFSYHAYRAVKELNEQQTVDVVVAPELFAQGLFVALFMRKTLITRIHTPTILVDRWNQRHRFYMISRILDLPEQYQARRSTALTCATVFLREEVWNAWNIPREKIRILPTGIDVERVRDLGMTGVREIQGRYLLYFGRLEHLKGVEVLAEALKSVFQKDHEINMIWIGRDWGSERKILATLAEHQKRMVFYDTMPKERLFPIVHHASLVILPSLFENFSNAALEAMSLERPVIGTNGTGFSEMIQNGVNGFLVERGNSVELAARIFEIMNRADLDEIGRRAYESVLQFDSVKVGRQMIRLFVEQDDRAGRIQM